MKFKIVFQVPMQVIKDSMNSRRSKFLRQSDPALKSLTGKNYLRDVQANFSRKQFISFIIQYKINEARESTLPNERSMYVSTNLQNLAAIK